jgi:mTERF domain-containing protein
MGVPRNTLLFRQAVTAVSGVGPETMASKLKMMAKILGCSDAEVARMVQRNLLVLRRSRERIQRTCEFLTNVVGVDTKYIQGRPTMLMYSLERRLVPRLVITCSAPGMYILIRMFFLALPMHMRLLAMVK